MAREGVTDYRITDLQASERPRERLEKQGAAALRLAELLAILLRVGVKGENALEVAQRVLDRFKGLRGLQAASFIELSGSGGSVMRKLRRSRQRLNWGTAYPARGYPKG